ncbi:MAG: hypothetical protein WC674_08905 [Candidatus Krumholzibacteriia bacterium]
MSCAMRFPAARTLVACALVCVMVQIVPAASARAEEKKSCTLLFSLPEGTVLHYKSFNQLDQNFSGTDVSMNQTSQVDMVHGSAPDSTGAARVDLKYIEVKSSLLSGGRLMDWSPPIKLEGATIRIMIMPNGDIVKFDPGRGVPGLQSVEDLREIIDAWFIRFPEEEIAVGQSWTEEIVREERDDGPPGAKGQMVYTLKKIEKKGDLEVAVIEGKMKLELNQDTPAGMLVGEGKADLKAQVALNGGYIVELKETIEIRGDIVAKDPLTDKETKRETAVTQIYERKLQQ